MRLRIYLIHQRADIFIHIFIDIDILLYLLYRGDNSRMVAREELAYRGERHFGHISDKVDADVARVRDIVVAALALDLLDRDVVLL